MITGENIVCISSHYWHGPWFRKQHFMWRFAKENRVLYVEPSFSMARRSPKHIDRNIATNRFFKAYLETVSDNLFLLKPPRGIPKWSNPVVSRLNYAWFAKKIDKTAKNLGMNNYILWVYPPQYATALKRFDYKKLVFDLADDYAEYGGQGSKHYTFVNDCVENLVQQSDITIVTAKTLLQRYKNKFPDSEIFHIPNGFDRDLFSNNVNKIETPDDVKDIKGRIIGFVGVLFKHLHYNIITSLADQIPNASIVLVGPMTEDTPVSTLSKYQNIYLLGKKPQEQIPKYVSHFNVCINPFKVNQLSKSINPLKVYEYLAMRKPVVSVPMEALESEAVSKLIHFAKTKKEFVKLVRKVLAGDLRIPKYDEVLEQYTWDSLFTKLLDKLDSIFKPDEVKKE